MKALIASVLAAAFCLVSVAATAQDRPRSERPAAQKAKDGVQKTQKKARQTARKTKSKAREAKKA